VAKKLKQCTKKLTIVLKENPDLEGEKVSQYRNELVKILDSFVEGKKDIP